MIGPGVFVRVWEVIAIWLAPLFAATESKEAHNAVRIKHYWPHDNVARLEIQNEYLAAMVQQAN